MAKRKLIVEIVGDSRSAQKAFKDVSVSARRFSVGFGQIAKAAVGFAAVTGAINQLSSAVRAGVSEFSEQEQIAAQTAAALKSTGSAAGVTAKEVDTLATSLSNLSGIDDELIKAGENTLLAFTQIRNAAGQGNDIFNQATRAVVDFAVRTKREVPAAAQILGRALADPAKRLSTLARAGIVFTDEQIKQVKAIQETSGVMAAQKVVLAELEKRFGGAARAAGDTLTGKLSVLRERFRDVAGDLVGLVAPAFERVVTSLSGFVKRLSAASTVRAKFRVVAEGIDSLGRDLLRQIEDAFRSTDFAGAVEVAQAQLAAGLQRIGEFLNRVDFREVGRSLGEAIERGLRGAASFFESVDWEFVGKRIVDGIGNFLKGANWKAIAVATFRLIAASFQATRSVVEGAAKAIGQGIVRALGNGIDSLAGFVKKKALGVVLAIVNALDFKIAGRSVVPGLGALRKKIERELEKIRTEAERTAKAVADAAAAISAATNSSRPEATGARSSSSGNRSTASNEAKAAADTATTTAKATTTAAQNAAAAALKAREAFDRLLDGLQLGFEKAQATARLDDDLDALRKIEAALKARLRVEQNSVDLQRQLFQVQQQQADIRQQQRDARQFKSLGLNADGSDVAATRAQITAQLRQVSKAIDGTVADTSRNNKTLAAIRKLILDPTRKVSGEVRDTIRRMLDDIQSQIGEAAKGPLTRTSGLNTRKIIEGLGLSGDQAREIRGRLSGFNTSGVGLAGAGRVPTGGFVGGVLVEAHTTVQLDGQTVGKTVTRHQQKNARRNPVQKRGPNRRHF